MSVKMPLQARDAAVVWALAQRPVYAEINNDLRKIRPCTGVEFDETGERYWSCRILEDENARFYVEVEQ